MDIKHQFFSAFTVQAHADPADLVHGGTLFFTEEPIRFGRVNCPQSYRIKQYFLSADNSSGCMYPITYSR